MKTGQWYHGDGPNSEPEPGMVPGSGSLDSKPAVPSHSPQLAPSSLQSAASTIAQEPSSLVASVSRQLQSRPDRHDDCHANRPTVKPQMPHPQPLLQTDVVTAPACVAEISDPVRRTDMSDHPGHRMDCRTEAPESGSRLDSTQGSRDPLQQQQHLQQQHQQHLQQQQQSDYLEGCTFQQNLGFVEQDVWNPAVDRQMQQPLREVSFIVG